MTLTGTCSENTRTVTVAVGAVNGTPTCTTGAWSTNLNLSTESSTGATANQTDAAGNLATQATRSNTRDVVASVVTLLGATTLTLAFGAVYTELGARWIDIVDGSGAATISGTVNTGIAGVYALSYKRTDLAGNMSNVVTRTVTVSPAPVSSGGGGGGSSSYIPPVVVVAATGSTQSGSTVVQLVIVTPSSNPNITQDIFVQKSTDFKKSKVIITTTTLKKGTMINVFRVLPNGKSIKVGTTRVLSNGKIRFITKTTGTFNFVQK